MTGILCSLSAVVGVSVGLVVRDGASRLMEARPGWVDTDVMVAAFAATSICGATVSHAAALGGFAGWLMATGGGM